MNHFELTSLLYLIVLNQKFQQWDNLELLLSQVRTKLEDFGFNHDNISNNFLYEKILEAVELKSLVKLALSKKQNDFPLTA